MSEMTDIIPASPTTTIFFPTGDDDFRVRRDPTTIVSLDAGGDDDFSVSALQRRFSPRKTAC